MKTDFYENLEEYHNKIEILEQLIVDYFSSINNVYVKTYSAVRIENWKITRSTKNINKEMENFIEKWYKKEEHDEVYNSIFKLEHNDIIFLFKLFEKENNKGNCVLAGYALKDGVNVRSFLSSVSEKVMLEKYEKILSII